MVAVGSIARERKDLPRGLLAVRVVRGDILGWGSSLYIAGSVPGWGAWGSRPGNRLA